MFKFEQPLNDPQNYYWYKEGFSKEELDKIYDNLANVPFQDATIIGSEEAPKEVRSSKIKWIPMNEEWSWLYEKLMSMAKTANEALWNFDLISAEEQIQYTEYHADDEGHYTWHQDIGPGDASLRKVSLTVQLSEPEEYEGGDLEMWQGGQSLQVAQRGAGVVFIFPSYMMHRVTKVTKGTRRSFVLWVGGQHYK
jgi:PKHD-type hydroxylase